MDAGGELLSLQQACGYDRDERSEAKFCGLIYNHPQLPPSCFSISSSSTCQSFLVQDTSDSPSLHLLNTLVKAPLQP